MPSDLVKTPAQESAWKMAKKQAAAEGHEDDFDYIVSIFSIFEKMKPKSKTPSASSARAPLVAAAAAMKPAKARPAP